MEASREVGIFFFFLFLFFNNYDVRTKLREKNHEKKSSSRPFLAHSGGGQETNIHLRLAPPPLVCPPSPGALGLLQPTTSQRSADNLQTYFSHFLLRPGPAHRLVLRSIPHSQVESVHLHGATVHLHTAPTGPGSPPGAPVHPALTGRVCTPTRSHCTSTHSSDRARLTAWCSGPSRTHR